MRPSLRKSRAVPQEPGVHGVVRVDPRTKSLTKRLRPGDIAVIDHLDLDRVSAEALVACAPAAVLNAARSTSGRYPNLGPDILVQAGIPLIDDLGPDVLTLVEGHAVRVHESAVYDGDRMVAEGFVHPGQRSDLWHGDDIGAMLAWMDAYVPARADKWLDEKLLNESLRKSLR